MRSWLRGVMCVVALVVVTATATSQPPDRPERGFGQRRGGSGNQERRGQQPRRGPGDQERRGQREGPGRPQNPIMQALDVDGDGELSADEIANVTSALRRLDRDGDGKLSRDELRPPREAQAGGGDRGQRPDGRRGRGQRRGPDDQGRGPEDQRRGPIRRSSRDEVLRREPSSLPDRPFQKLPRSPIPGFVPIPGGVFEMGDHHDLGGREHRNDEVPIHTVRVDSFYMSATEMTNKQYCGYLNGALANRLIEVKDGFVRGAGGNDVYCDTRQSDRASQILWNGRQFSVVDSKESHPVVCVRWLGAVACCNWLSAHDGYETCYDLATGKCDYSKRGYRLPSEAEWEYAARGGLHSPYRIFPWGDDADNSKANWPRSGDPYETGPYPWTTPVGFYNGQRHRQADFNWPGPQSSYQTSDGANGFGLYDMAGNVWEWVNDWYNRDYYATCPVDNPPGPERGTPVTDGRTYRVLRSGNWFNGLQGHSRVSNRNPSYYRGPGDPNHSYYHIGFRLVLKTSDIK